MSCAPVKELPLACVGAGAWIVSRFQAIPKLPASDWQARLAATEAPDVAIAFGLSAASPFL